ncbi:MAG: hypothetical protein QXI09_02240 [Candidatus Aenigmatarchaeota archaeon]
MPISTAPYRRKYEHTHSRGSETVVECSFCGRRLPRYKAFILKRKFSINDPTLKKQIDPKYVHSFERKYYVCPSCARFRGIAQPGKSVRKKHLQI